MSTTQAKKQIRSGKARRAGDKAEQACQKMLKCRVSFSWLGSVKQLRPDLKQETASNLNADYGAVSAGTALYNWGVFESLNKIRAFKTEVVAHWRSHTAPWPEDGYRLLRKDSVEEFEKDMNERKERFLALAKVVQQDREKILEDAKKRRGRAFHLTDYPGDLSTAFSLTWGYASLVVPDELKEISEGAYSAEISRHQAQMLAAVSLAEESFLAQLGEMTSALAAKLLAYDDVKEDGKKKYKMKDAAVENLRDFIQEFSRVVGWEAEEVSEVFEAAGQVIQGVEASDLRRSREARAKVAEGLKGVSERLAKMLPSPLLKPEGEPLSLPDPVPEPVPA